VSHSLFACDLFCTLSRGLDYISNANPACSCDYFENFSFALFTPSLGDFQVSSFIKLSFFQIKSYSVYQGCLCETEVRKIFEIQSKYRKNAPKGTSFSPK
jgi:hypothetical protein